MTSIEVTDETRNVSLPNGRTKEIPNLCPPDDWALYVFLLEVSDMVEDEDLERMKLLCTGKGGFGRGVLERLDNIKFFDLLRQSERITKHNLIFLQALLWSIGRKDIHKKFVEFSRKHEDIIHIFAPKDSPENGYKFVKFHIGGDTSNYSSKSLKDMRANVASLLRVPERFVFISGIEPSTSLLITLMIPEDVVYVLLEMTEVEMKEMARCGIVDITVDETTITITGERPTDVFLNERVENKKLLQDVTKLEKEIESLQTKLIEANAALRINTNLANKQKYSWIQKKCSSSQRSSRSTSERLPVTSSQFSSIGTSQSWPICHRPFRSTSKSERFRERTQSCKGK